MRETIHKVCCIEYQFCEILLIGVGGNEAVHEQISLDIFRLHRDRTLYLRFLCSICICDVKLQGRRAESIDSYTYLTMESFFTEYDVESVFL